MPILRRSGKPTREWLADAAESGGANVPAASVGYCDGGGASPLVSHASIAGTIARSTVCSLTALEGFWHVAISRSVPTPLPPLCCAPGTRYRCTLSGIGTSWPLPSVTSSDARPPQNSNAVSSCMIFGQVRVVEQLFSSPSLTPVTGSVVTA